MAAAGGLAEAEAAGGAVGCDECQRKTARDGCRRRWDEMDVLLWYDVGYAGLGVWFVWEGGVK